MKTEIPSQAERLGGARKLLRAAVDILDHPAPEALLHARRLLACAAESELRPTLRAHVGSQGADERPISLDVSSRHYRALAAATPDIAPALAAYATDPLILLLETARHELPGHHAHAVGVARMVMRIARRLNWQPLAIDAVACAGLFHDLGQVLVAIAGHEVGLADRARPRDAGAFAQLTYMLLMACDVVPSICLAVAQHHECLDGSGTPLALAGDEVGIGARLITVAELIHGETEVEPHLAALSTAEVVATLLEGAHAEFDRHLAIIAAAMIAEKDMRA